MIYPWIYMGKNGYILMLNTMADEIRKRQNNIKHTFHAIRKEYIEGITAEQIDEAIKDNFEVIEDYPDDPRGPSCLVLCRIDTVAYHIVCAPHEDSLVIITVYKPTREKWSKDWKSRR